MEEQAESMIQKIQAKSPRVGSSVQFSTCHECKRQKVVLGCFPQSSCDAKYCDLCLKKYSTDFNDVLENSESWQCPYAKGKCTCQACSVKNLNVYCLERTSDVVQSALDYNAALLSYMDQNLETLTKQDLDYCRKVIHQNLKNLSKVSDFQKSS